MAEEEKELSPMGNEMQQYDHYGLKILGQISDMFEDPDCPHHIDPAELQEGDNLTHFFHALANVAPAVLYNRVTGDHKNNLEFNHVANQLVFQFSNKVNKVKDGEDS